jgi:diguanylate cyclase
LHYDDSLEKSAEYLRQAIQLMSRQKAALHPVTYAVWYEYVAGRNQALRQAIDSLTQNGKQLDEAATNALFRKHVAELDEATAQRVTTGLQKVMADISQSTSQAGDQADQFGSVLAKWTESAGGVETDQDHGVGTLLDHTRRMQGAIGALKGKLDDSHREIEQLRQEVKRAREDALADGLTGLANRKAFDMALATCLAGTGNQETGPSLLITDIDFFKKVNDSYGHVFGDKVIKAVAQILKDNVKGKDTAARFGGEEFVVLLPETPVNGAAQLAERIRGMVERLRIKRLDKNEAIASITVSLGVATYRKGETPSEFIARADTALYDAKHNGRNKVCVAAV